MSLIIGLSGRKQSGKDTIAKIIKQYVLDQNLNYFQLSFARPVKEITSILTGYPLKAINGEDPLFDREQPLEEFNGLTIRQIMQLFGTDFGRNMLSEDIWINALQKKLNLYEQVDNAIYVVTDIRFNNEAEFIRNKPNGKILHISRDVLNSDQHESELGPDILSKDIKIENNGSIESLKVKIYNILMYLIANNGIQK